MDKAAYQSKQAMDKMKKDAEMVGRALGAMAVTGVAALGYMVKTQIDAMDEMSKLAQKTGTTTESLSALSYAAGLSGVGTEALGKAMIKLAKNMSDAGQGTGEAIKGFAALGISVTNSDGSMKNSDVVISELAKKFATFKDGANKTALAVSIFGKTGADLIPLLNSGADGIKIMTDEASRFGLVMDTEASKAAEQFNDDLERLILTKNAFSNAVVVAVLPALQAVATEMLGASNEADKFKTASSAVKIVLETFLVLGSEVAFTFKGVGTEIGGLAAQLARLAHGDLKGFTAISDAMKADAIKARTEHDAFIASIMGNTPANWMSGYGKHQSGGNALGNAPTIRTTPTGGSKSSGVPESSRALASYVDGLAKVLEKNDQLTESEKALNFLRSLGATGEIANVRELVTGMAAQIDKEADIADWHKQNIANVIAEGEAVTKANEEYQALLKNMLDATPTKQLEKQRAEMTMLADELEAGRISEQLYLEAVTANLGLVADKTDTAKTAADEFGMTMASAFEGAIVNGKEFGDVVDGLAQDILRMTLRKAVTDPLSGWISKGITAMLPSFAVGTDYVPRDMVAQIHQGERIVPAAQNHGGSDGGITINIAATVGDIASKSDVVAGMRATANQITASLSRGQRYGGVMA